MEQGIVDNVRRFLAECTVGGRDDTESTPAADLYGMYIIWSERNGTGPVSVQHFSSVVRLEGVEAERRNHEQVYTNLLPTGSIPIQYILETDKAPSPNSTLGVFPA